jgi:hypothetical protein
MKSTEFFATHHLFPRDQASKALTPRGGRFGTEERLKYHLRTGRQDPVAPGVYAVTPPGVTGRMFLLDPFLGAAAFRS